MSLKKCSVKRGGMVWIFMVSQNSCNEIIQWSPKSDVSGRWGLWEAHDGGALITGTNALNKKILKISLASSTLWGHSGKLPAWVSKRALALPGCYLDLGFSGLYNCEKIIPVVYKLPSLWYFYIETQNGVRQDGKYFPKCPYRLLADMDILNIRIYI